MVLLLTPGRGTRTSAALPPCRLNVFVSWPEVLGKRRDGLIACNNRPITCWREGPQQSFKTKDFDQRQASKEYFPPPTSKKAYQKESFWSKGYKGQEKEKGGGVTDGHLLAGS